MRTGKLKVNNKLNGIIKVGRKQYRVPKFYDLSPREKWNNQNCEFELKEGGGQVVKILVDGKELPKDQNIVKEQQAKQVRKQQREEREQKRAEQAEKYRDTFDYDSFNTDMVLLPSDTQKIISQ